jgi:hypothetical protein
VIINGPDRDGATSAADGSFRIVGLEPGKYKLSTDPPNQRDDAGPVVEVPAGTARTGITITIEAKDGVIRGTVVDADGKPTADAWIMAFEADSEASRPALSSSDGRFTIEHLRKSTYRVVATGPRGASHGEKDGVNPGDTVTIQLAALGTLAVRVTGQGAAVTSYDLACKSVNGELDRRVDSADGTYTLEHLAPGAYDCTVAALHGTSAGRVAVPAGNASLELELVPYATVTGTVVSVLSGQPVSGICALAGTDARQVQDVMTGTAPVTDAAGRFTIDRVTPGDGAVVLFPQSVVTQELAQRPYTATAGQQLDLGVIQVVPPRTGDAGTLGMATELGDGALVVTLLQPGGPAAQAGIVVGDQVTVIDSHAVAQLTSAIAQKLLASGNVSAGQTLALTLRRGATVSVTAAKW